MDAARLASRNDRRAPNHHGRTDGDFGPGRTATGDGTDRVRHTRHGSLACAVSVGHAGTWFRGRQPTVFNFRFNSRLNSRFDSGRYSRCHTGRHSGRHSLRGAPGYSLGRSFTQSCRNRCRYTCRQR